MKVALVTDWIYGGGGERVVEEIHKLYPDAPIYTSYCSKNWRKRLDNKVVTGYLQVTPFRQFRKFLPLLRQRWFATIDLSDFDLVISITGNGEAKFVRVPNGQHISYCHTPVHFYWRKYREYLKNPGFRPKWLARIGLKLLVKPLRNRDYQAAQKVDRFIANSTHIKEDIKQFYRRDSIVIHPPVDIGRFGLKKDRRRHGFVVVGRQTPYKRFDIAVKACNELGLPLTVVGTGPENKKLRRLAGKSIKFVTDANDQELVSMLQSSVALIFPQEEDFGIVAVEAMAAGTPVIAYRGGGALDYVVNGKTGMFFSRQEVKSLVETLRTFSKLTFNSADIKKTAQKFSNQTFGENFLAFISKLGNVRE